MTKTVEIRKSTPTPTSEPSEPPAKVVQPIHLRAAVSTDLAFVFETWLRDFSHSTIARSMDPRIYNHEQARVITRLMRESGVAIACDEDQPDTILGWGCGELWRDPSDAATGAVVHYLYVSNQFRRRAIGARILEHLVGEDAIAGRLPLFYSHLPDSRIVKGERVPGVAIGMAKRPQYNPYLAFTR